jgi:opacity protein-like surface antigen
MTKANRTSPAHRVLLGTLAVGITLCTAAPARAQGFISPMIGYDFGGDTGCPKLTTLIGCEDKKINISVSFGAMGRVVGFEEEIGYAPSFFGSAPALSSSVLTAMSNFMVAPKIGGVRPYVVAGVGLIKTHVDLTTTSLLTTSNNAFGWDIGGGLIGYFNPHVGLRGDIRYFHSFTDLSILGVSLNNATQLDFARASAGLVFSF